MDSNEPSCETFEKNHMTSPLSLRRVSISNNKWIWKKEKDDGCKKLHRTSASVAFWEAEATLLHHQSLWIFPVRGSELSIENKYHTCFLMQINIPIMLLFFWEIFLRNEINQREKIIAEYWERTSWQSWRFLENKHGKNLMLCQRDKWEHYVHTAKCKVHCGFR